MAIRAKVDEDLPDEIAIRMRAVGHDATTVAEQGLIGSPDETLWPVVQDEGRWLLTADRGFADARSYPPGSHAGIVLFRLRRESRRGYLQLAEHLLRHLDFQRAAGSIVVVTPEAIRIHRSPRTD